MAHLTPPQWDRDMRRRLGDGDAAALSELYDRFATLAYGIAQRILGGDEEAAGEVTREVFARLWERPDRFDPSRGPLRTWIADATHRLAVARLRDRPGPGTPDEVAERIRNASTAARADYIVASMPAPLHEALRLTRFRRHDCRETARRLGITEAETRRRLRLGLQLLSSASRYDPDAAGGAVR
ncbi:sigma-70 family RNA polymerase sigma factor [Streptomyces sp. NPDC049879]|uniref:sigma-70 family RNA polymerase sigma factor n=1 Tax=Streptomyces sp. NPDC049879 TaxID=3365598 RepID=UPI0037A83FA0